MSLTILGLTFFLYGFGSHLWMSTGLQYMAGPMLRECCQQVETEVVSNSRNKIHQTWGPPYIGALYCIMPKVELLSATQKSSFALPNSSNPFFLPKIPQYQLPPSVKELTW